MAAALSLASCSVAELESSTASTDNGPKITLVGHSYTDTKVSVGPKNGSVYPLFWTADDVIAIYSTSGTKRDEAIVVSDHGTSSATFQTTGSYVPTSDENVYIIYPVNAEVASSTVSMTIPAVQDQFDASSSDHLGFAALAIASTTIEANQTKGVEFTLEQKTAFVKVSLTTTEYKDYYLDNVTLYAKGKKLAGKMKVSLSSGSVTSSETEDYVGADVGDGSPIVFGESNDVYFTALPCDLTGNKVTLIVRMKRPADNATVTIPVEIDGGKLEASKLSVIKVDNLSVSSNSYDWYEPVELRHISDKGNGWAYGPENCYVAYFTGGDWSDAVEFDVKARGNFMECAKPVSVRTLAANAVQSSDKIAKNNLEINGTVCHNGSNYERLQLDGNYNLSIRAKDVNSYGGYSSVVAIYDESENIIWSFNIWGNADQLVEQTYNNGVLLDRSIGAYKSGGVYVSSSYYQWGRPFPSGWSASGIWTKSDTNTDKADLRKSAANPLNFYTCPSEKGSGILGDWYYGHGTDANKDRAQRIDDLWYSTKTIYDPCPEGYMVPSFSILSEMLNNAAPARTDIKVVENSNYSPNEPNQLVYSLSGSEKAIWPMGGCKWGDTGGNPHNAKADIASSWSHEVQGSEEGSRAKMLYYRYRDGWQPDGQASARAHGHPVRCMKIQ